MANCKIIRKINEIEYIGDSLITINNNFFNLNAVLCNLKRRLETKVEIRTVFYHGIDPITGQNTATLNMQNNTTSRPSNNTIRNFVNSPNQLNLLPNSKRNDQVYVIYQKTGYKLTSGTRLRTGSQTVVSPQTKLANPSPFFPQGVPVPDPKTTVVPWSTTFPDLYTIYSPAFILWLLVHDGVDYKVSSGFPKFLQAETSSTLNWNNPRSWATY
jgi:hypothetical protein